MFARNAASTIAESVADTPVLLLNGARQTGKSTLLASLTAADVDRRYVTLDDPSVLDAARSDPAEFIRGLGPFATIDEVQRAPEIFLAIKASVDRDRRPGRFLLTGSADVLLLPRLSDALVGRMEVVTLGPLSQGELAGVREGFIDRVFTPGMLAALPAESALARDDLIDRLLRGGFPEAVTRASDASRRRWFENYVTTLLYRDVREISNIDGLTVVPQLLRLIAGRAGSEVVVAEISRSLGVPYATMHRYVALLRTTFLVQPLPAWTANVGRRVAKNAKLFLLDSGLAAHLCDVTRATLSRNATALGGILETFVLTELQKQAGWSEARPRFFFFRDYAGAEVDIVMEDRGGRVIGIEVKATGSPNRRMFRGLEILRDGLGDRFQRGLLLHTGDQSIAFGDRLSAAPIGSLWADCGLRSAGSVV